MLIPVARYTFLLWLFINPQRDPEKLRLEQMEGEDQNIYRTTACTASCMQQFPQQQLHLLQLQQQELGPQLQYQFSHFENCFLECRNASASSSAEEEEASAPSKKNIRKIQENFSLNLICRDDRSLTFRIDLESTTAAAATAISNKRNLTTTANEGRNEIAAGSAVAAATTLSTLLHSSAPPAIAANTAATTTAKGQPTTDTIFIIRIHVAKDAEEYLVFLSDDSFFTIDELKNNTAHNISVVAMHASGEYSVIAKQQQYATLQRGFTPGMVKDIQVRNFYVDEANDMLLMAKIAWKPSADMTCRYNIICFAPESEEYDLTPLEIRSPRQLYTYNLENLTFSSVYKVGIRAKNPHNLSKESELKWQTFTAPTCVQWYNYNFNICAPLEPDGLEVEQIFRGENEFSLNITWQPTQHFPDYFTARILDLSELGISFVTNVSKELTSLYVPKIPLNGILFEVQLTAYTPGGSSTAVLTLLTQQHPTVSDRNHIVKLISAIIALVFCIAILSLTIFIICHRRAKLKRYQERCKYFEELEKKAPIDPKAAFEFPTKSLPTLLSAPEDDLTQFQLEVEEKMFFIDAMEIERSAITLYEVLGEGAFGLVRRGLFIDEKSGQREVAVKMLKDQPSSDDVRAFRREIEVMKSVERHPNIVGIIGHCTKSYNDMLLLTEYCSLGNLLDFLRDEWKYLHELNTKSSASNNFARPRLPSRTRSANSNNNNNSSSNNNSSNNNSSNNKSKQRHRTNSDNRNRRNSSERNNSATTMHRQRHRCNNNNNEASSNNNYKSCNNNSNASNIDATLIEKLKLKYKSLNTMGGQQQQQQQQQKQQKQQQHCTKEYHQTEGATIHIEDIGTTTTTSNASTATATDNKSYGYDEICTNSCKCQVDIVSSGDADNAITDVDPSDSHRELQQLERMLQQQQQHQQRQQKQTIPPAKTIEVKNCDCQQQRQQLLLSTNNKRNAAVANKSYFDGDASTNSNKQSSHNNIIDNNDAFLPRIPLSAGDLIDIARQVAVGMEFLAKNKVVHRDLAARNVLVAPDRTIKIADFGLSRDIYQENIYKKTGNGKLPIKWLALESMTHQVYTTQSDVWSYGVLLYEIVTLGGSPYPAIPTNRLLHMLKSGFRMEKPRGCSQEFYNLMYSCWHVNPGERPNFTEIIKHLDNLMCETTPTAEQIESVVSSSGVSSPPQTEEEEMESPEAEASEDAYLQPL